ncbi:MAG: STAS domain-containing protein [Deltaproteobacteria bacterium]|nr:STAS domain-containing protein [Deltaproteobacteria bacterium]
MLEFQRLDQDGLVILALSGRLDALSAPDFRPTIDELVQSRTMRVVFDLTGLQQIDSSGVGAIVSLFKRLRMLGGEVKIACLNGQPREIFRLLRLDRAFDLFDTVDAAKARFGKRGA